MTTETRLHKSVSVGDALPPFEKKVRLPDMMAYAAATWDFARIHYDAPYARSQRLPSPVVDGQMLGAFLAQLVQNWAGPTAFLQNLEFRNAGMVFPGDVLTCGGSVTAIRQEDVNTLIDCDLWIDNQEGERVVAPASATITLPSRDNPQ